MSCFSTLKLGVVKLGVVARVLGASTLVSYLSRLHARHNAEDQPLILSGLAALEGERIAAPPTNLTGCRHWAGRRWPHPGNREGRWRLAERCWRSGLWSVYPRGTYVEQSKSGRSEERSVERVGGCRGKFRV